MTKSIIAENIKQYLKEYYYKNLDYNTLYNIDTSKDINSYSDEYKKDFAINDLAILRKGERNRKYNQIYNLEKLRKYIVNAIEVLEKTPYSDLDDNYKSYIEDNFKVYYLSAKILKLHNKIDSELDKRRYNFDAKQINKNIKSAQNEIKNLDNSRDILEKNRTADLYRILLGIAKDTYIQPGENPKRNRDKANKYKNDLLDLISKQDDEGDTFKYDNPLSKSLGLSEIVEYFNSKTAQWEKFKLPYNRNYISKLITNRGGTIPSYQIKLLTLTNNKHNEIVFDFDFHQARWKKGATPEKLKQRLINAINVIFVDNPIDTTNIARMFDDLLIGQKVFRKQNIK